jgi:hypothetical protein
VLLLALDSDVGDVRGRKLSLSLLIISALYASA